MDNFLVMNDVVISSIGIIIIMVYISKVISVIRVGWLGYLVSSCCCMG